MRVMPQLETDRLLIRPFMETDVADVHAVLDSIDLLDQGETPDQQLSSTQQYVRWGSLNQQQLARLDQPPYGDRAVVLRSSTALIGCCGLVPYIDDLGMYPYFGGKTWGYTRPEIGLYWSIHADHHKRGYATEVAKALIAYALDGLNLHHVIATTSYDNLASQRVMKKAGMELQSNPGKHPPWREVLAISARIAP